jgi:hypothetical protein
MLAFVLNFLDLCADVLLGLHRVMIVLIIIVVFHAREKHYVVIV